MSPDVEVDQFLSTRLGRLLRARLKVEDAYRADSCFVQVALEEALHLNEGHLYRCLSEREDLTHTHTEELVVAALGDREEALVLLQFSGGLACLKGGDERLRRERCRHPKLLWFVD